MKKATASGKNTRKGSKTQTLRLPQVEIVSQHLPSLEDMVKAMKEFGLTVPQSERERYSEFLKMPIPAGLDLTVLPMPLAKRRPSKKPAKKRAKSRRSIRKAPINL